MKLAERESLLLAPYAMRAADSAGRPAPEAEHPYRSPYQRDRDRITHCAAFRRLSRKTQVFTGELVYRGARGDYHRTRLTHTLEVASIARTIARALRLNEDLVEALALAHDVGHPPFGHAGEEALDERLVTVGGFNHNRQAVRLFERLERSYPDRPGLNLSHEVLEGQGARGHKPARDEAGLSPDPFPTGSPLLEVQVVDAADSIAYDSHDADDALEVGLVTLNDLSRSTLWRESVSRAHTRHAALSDEELRRVAVHDLIDHQVSDLVTRLRESIEREGIDSVMAVRDAPLVAKPSQELAELKLELEALLFRCVYRHPLVVESRSIATEALHRLFDDRLARCDELPEPFAAVARDESPQRAVGDYVASLTDRAVLSGEA